MNRKQRWMCTAALALTAVGVAVAANAQAPDGDAVSGQRLYYEHACYACHGYNGETGRPLLGSGFLRDEAAFIQFLRLRAEQNPMLPSTQMPNYSVESLSDAQAKDLFAYVATFEADDPPLDDIPVLQRIIAAGSRPYEP